MSVGPALETGPLGKVGARRAGSEGRLGTLGLFLDFFTCPSSHLPLLTPLSLSEASLADGRCLHPELQLLSGFPWVLPRGFPEAAPSILPSVSPRHRSCPVTFHLNAQHSDSQAQISGGVERVSLCRPRTQSIYRIVRNPSH